MLILIMHAFPVYLIEVIVNIIYVKKYKTYDFILFFCLYFCYNNYDYKVMVIKMIDFIINNINLLDCDLFSPAEYKLISKVYNWILVIVPAIVLALCTVDIAKAVIAQDDNAVKKAQGNAIKRIIAGVIMFFIPVILNLILGVVSHDINFGGTCVEEISKEITQE